MIVFHAASIGFGTAISLLDDRTIRDIQKVCLTLLEFMFLSIEQFDWRFGANLIPVYGCQRRPLPYYAIPFEVLYRGNLPAPDTSTAT